MTQYSLFGAAAAPPHRSDLDGLLLAGGQWVRSSAGARLSVVVADRWRADALAETFAALGLDGPDAVVAAQDGHAARTAFDAELRDAAARWTRGARTGLPPGFELGVGGLRLWAIAAGRRDESGYLLGTAVQSNVTPEDVIHQAAGSQLARLGVAAQSLTRRGTRWGVGWRVTSVRRLRRLGELLGPAPDGAGDDWPEPLEPSLRGLPG